MLIKLKPIYFFFLLAININAANVILHSYGTSDKDGFGVDLKGIILSNVPSNIDQRAIVRILRNNRYKNYYLKTQTSINLTNSKGEHINNLDYSYLFPGKETGNNNWFVLFKNKNNRLLIIKIFKITSSPSKDGNRHLYLAHQNGNFDINYSPDLNFNAIPKKVPSSNQFRGRKPIDRDTLSRLSNRSAAMRVILNPEWKRIFDDYGLAGPYAYVENEIDKIYLPGKEPNKANIDWEKTFNRLLKIIESNRQYVIDNGKIPKSYKADQKNVDKLLIRADFSGHDFSLDKGYLSLNEANLSMANFSEAKFDHLRMVMANAHKVNFSHAIFSYGTFSNSDLSQADFSYAIFETGFFGSTLLKANLSNAKFNKANFFLADLREADLSNVVCKECKFEASNLSETIFTGMDISGHKFNRSFHYVDGKRKDVTINYLKERGAIWDPNNPPSFKFLDLN